MDLAEILRLLPIFWGNINHIVHYDKEVVAYIMIRQLTNFPKAKKIRMDEPRGFN